MTTIITYYYPPDLEANAFRPWRIGCELARRGERVRIVTRWRESRCDAAGAEPSGIDLVQIKDVVEHLERRTRHPRLVRAVLRRLWPDMAVLWSCAVQRWWRRHGRRSRGSVLVAVNPQSNLLVARAIARTGGNVIIDYLEAVTPFRQQVPFEHFPHRALMSVLERVERSALSKCQMAVFTSADARAAYDASGLIPTERTLYLPHACDPVPGAELCLPTNAEFVVAYFGAFNSYRPPDTFLHGVKAFLQREPGATTRLRIDLYGNGLELFPDWRADTAIMEVIRERGMVGREEGLGKLAQSHVLLLVVGDPHRLFFPSKLAEYVASRRPILSILPHNTEVDFYLRRSGRDRWIVRNGDANGVAHALSALWREFCSVSEWPPLAEVPEVLFENQANEWLNILAKVR